MTDREIGRAIIEAFDKTRDDEDLHAAVGYLFGVGAEEEQDRVCCAVAEAAREALRAAGEFKVEG